MLIVETGEDSQAAVGSVVRFRAGNGIIAKGSNKAFATEVSSTEETELIDVKMDKDSKVWQRF